MVEVQITYDVMPHGERSLRLSQGERFLVLRPMRNQHGQDVFIIRNRKGLDGEVLKRNIANFNLPDWFQMVDRRAAESQLTRSQPGKFIVRPTTHGRDGEYSVSVKYARPGDVHHFKLVYDSGHHKWTMWGQRFKTLQDFVMYFQTNPIARRGQEQVRLDRRANVEVLIIQNNAAMNRYEEGDDDFYEDDLGQELSDEEDESENEMSNDPSIVEGSVVKCIEEYLPDEEGTLYMRPGDRLLVLYPPTEGWVYVKKGEQEEGYVPEELVQCERR